MIFVNGKTLNKEQLIRSGSGFRIYSVCIRDWHKATESDSPGGSIVQ